MDPNEKITRIIVTGPEKEETKGAYDPNRLPDLGGEPIKPAKKGKTAASDSSTTEVAPQATDAFGNQLNRSGRKSLENSFNRPVASSPEFMFETKDGTKKIRAFSRAETSMPNPLDQRGPKDEFNTNAPMGSLNGLRSGVSVEDDLWKAEFSLVKALNSKQAQDDTVASGSLRFLNSVKDKGMYIGVEKGSKFEMIVAAAGMAVENGKIGITTAFLQRVLSMEFPEVHETKDVPMKQKSIGVDYTKYFGKGSFLQELKGALVYSDTANTSLGTIGYIVTETAETVDGTRILGGARGGTKLQATATGTFKLAENVK